jgi:N-acetylmuramoyl-L-alanine amidase
MGTAGKRSPVWKDMPQLHEWRYTREVVNLISDNLRKAGIPTQRIVPELSDIPVWERVMRANRIAKAIGSSKCLLVSVHVNASKDGKASGWEIHTSKGQTLSDFFARHFWIEANRKLPVTVKKRGDHSDKDPDWDSNFAILRDTKCPAVLTENLFMDNEGDCRYLLSDEGLSTIVDIHTESIIRINKEFK